MITYEEWCKKNTNILPLVRSLKSSLPEQYIGFYLHTVFGDEVEYQKNFDWLGKCSLDIFIPSLQLAIEYDGFYFHSQRKASDNWKTRICRSYKINLIRILEQEAAQPENKNRNEITYYYSNNYKNIDVAIKALFERINKEYKLSLTIDVDIERDAKELIAYVQNKYYKKSIAHIWPESKDYWLDSENSLTIFDVFYTDNRCFVLKCPHCKRKFNFHIRYFHDRKSLIPCECEYKEIEKDYEEAIKNYIEKGNVEPFNESLRSRRLYDRMASIANNIWRCRSKEEAELYKKLGFESPYLDIYLSEV